jgi:hypothetical protein
MNDERNRGVTEARFGLTVLICLLVAMGYIVLLRLGSPTDSTVEIRPEPPVAREVTTPIDPNEPQVLPIEPQRQTVPQMSARPDYVPTTPHGAAAEPDRYPVVPATSLETQRR